MVKGFLTTLLVVKLKEPEQGKARRLSEDGAMNPGGGRVGVVRRLERRRSACAAGSTEARLLGAGSGSCANESKLDILKTSKTRRRPNVTGRAESIRKMKGKKGRKKMPVTVRVKTVR